MAVKRRAISEQQKQQRRQAILDVALQLFQEITYEAVNMSDVAGKAGLAKGTLYLYFKTKEELFLAIQTQTFEAWFDEADDQLQALRSADKECTIDEVVAVIRRCLENRPVMIRLVAILHTILEQNIDYATALSFKHMLRDRVLQTGPLLEACLPFLPADGGAQLLLRIHALVIGLQHMADPAPIVRQVLEEPDLAMFKIDFMEQLESILKTLLQGMKDQSKGITSKLIEEATDEFKLI